MITRTVASWVAGLEPSRVPEDVRASLRLLGLDTFGAALAGTDLPWTRAIRDWAAAGGAAGAGGATVWGARTRLRAADAALVNGAAAHAYELDDFHNAKLHLGAVMLPTVFALGEARGTGMPRMEAALAAGYEVAIRSSLALVPAHARLRGWHLTAVCGPLGAAAAASVILGLDAERTAWALGLAGTQSGGLYAFSVDGTDSKRFHPGRAAHAGIMSAEMAELGLTGPASLYEAEDGGWLRAFSDRPEPEQLTQALGAHWHARETNFKPYGCCGSVHPHVDAALALRERWRQAGRVRAGMASVVDVQCGYRYVPGTALNAQMSARYALAVALLDGAVLPDQFSPGRLDDPLVVDLANRIEIVRDPDLDARYPREFCGWVEVDTETGPVRVDVDNPSGGAGNPGRADGIRSKFEALTHPRLGPERATCITRGFVEWGDVPIDEMLSAAAH
ncbi:MAG: MmgE/PrpD family protein [Burkholderiales bacterium]|nr:MmgE/PrpD family protein [Burkholderiales bacterium]